MADDKRIIQGYEVLHAIQLGGAEVILAENKNDAKTPYMVCECRRDNPFGAEWYQNAMGSADFVEIMKLFAQRLSERVDVLEAQRDLRGIPMQTLTASDCDPAGEIGLKGRVVVIKPESLAPEYRTIDYQLALCTGGFGASPNSRGRTVYCQDLLTGETSPWKREDIAGTLQAERLPDWARVNLEALRPSAGKDTPAVEPLGKDQFWQMIDAARETAGGRWQDMYEPLVESISRLEEQDIIRFKQIFDEYQSLSYKDKLWAAASVMLNGCSDDSFDYFRGWLTAQGKDVFMNALADPDSLTDAEAVKVFAREVCGSSYYTFSDEYRESPRFESMLNAAGAAYEKKLGKDADIYDVIDSKLLTEQEKKAMASEIVYAEDIDAKWFAWGAGQTRIDSRLQQLVPKLRDMFDYSNNKECDLSPAAVKKPAEKESVLDAIKRDRQEKKQGDHHKPKTTKKDKSGPEL